MPPGLSTQFETLLARLGREDPYPVWCELCTLVSRLGRLRVPQEFEHLCDPSQAQDDAFRVWIETGVQLPPAEVNSIETEVSYYQGDMPGASSLPGRPDILLQFRPTARAIEISASYIPIPTPSQDIAVLLFRPSPRVTLPLVTFLTDGRSAVPRITRSLLESLAAETQLTNPDGVLDRAANSVWLRLVGRIPQSAQVTVALVPRFRRVPEDNHELGAYVGGAIQMGAFSLDQVELRTAECRVRVPSGDDSLADSELQRVENALALQLDGTPIPDGEILRFI